MMMKMNSKVLKWRGKCCYLTSRCRETLQHLMKIIFFSYSKICAILVTNFYIFAFFILVVSLLHLNTTKQR